MRKKVLNILCSETNLKLLKSIDSEKANRELFKIYHYISLFSNKLVLKNIKGDNKFLFDGRWMLSKLFYELDRELGYYLINNLKPFIYETKYPIDNIELASNITEYHFITLYDRQKYIYNRLLSRITTKPLSLEEKWLIYRWIFKANIILEKLNALFYYNQEEKPVYNNLSLDLKFKPGKILPIEWIPVVGGMMSYGNSYNNNYEDDTQTPSGNYYIKSFWMTKNTITIGQYLDFINADGYEQNKYWSLQGWNWIKSNKIFLPDNWKYENKNITINGTDIRYYLNHPVSHISWWEADACARWIGGKLPNEYEWEWVSTNRNKTPYPNGLEKPYSAFCNLNSLSNETLSNDYILQDLSIMGFNNLFGNVWEWCDSKYSPYTGWKNDPFHNSEFQNNTNKKIVRGGSFNTFNSIISSQMRWGINGSCRYYPTGFRIIKYK